VDGRRVKKKRVEIPGGENGSTRACRGVKDCNGRDFRGNSMTSNFGKGGSHEERLEPGKGAVCFAGERGQVRNED